MHAKEWQVFNIRGEPKYVSEAEFGRFIAFTARLAADRRAFARLVAYTGCRISEALALRRAGILEKDVVLPTLKRRRIAYRVFPVPEELIADLHAVPVNEKQPDRVWSVNRSTGYRWIVHVMQAEAVQVEPPHASPRGLRHGFGLRGGAARIPQGILQNLYGHAMPTTTSIYIEAFGEDLRAMVRRTW